MGPGTAVLFKGAAYATEETHLDNSLVHLPAFRAGRFVPVSSVKKRQAADDRFVRGELLLELRDLLSERYALVAQSRILVCEVSEFGAALGLQDSYFMPRAGGAP